MPRRPTRTQLLEDDLPPMTGRESFVQSVANTGRSTPATVGAAQKFIDQDPGGGAGGLSRELVLGADEGSFSRGDVPLTPGLAAKEQTERNMLAAERRGGVSIDEQRRQLESQRQAAPPQGGARLTFMGQTQDFTKEQVRAGEVGRWRASVAAQRALDRRPQAGPARPTTIAEQDAQDRQVAAQQEAQMGAEARTERLANREAEIRKWYEDQGIIPRQGGAAPEPVNPLVASMVEGGMSESRARVELARLQGSASTADKRQLAQIQSTAQRASNKAEREARVAESKAETQAEKLRLEAREDAQREQALGVAEDIRTSEIEQEAIKGNREFQKFLITRADDELFGLQEEAKNAAGDPVRLRSIRERIRVVEAKRDEWIEMGFAGADAEGVGPAPAGGEPPSSAITAEPEPTGQAAPAAIAPQSRIPTARENVQQQLREGVQGSRERLAVAPRERLEQEFDTDGDGAFSLEEFREMRKEYTNILRALADPSFSDEAKDAGRKKLKDIQDLMRANAANPFSGKQEAKRPVVSVGGPGGALL